MKNENEKKQCQCKFVRRVFNGKQVKGKVIGNKTNPPPSNATHNPVLT